MAKSKQPQEDLATERWEDLMDVRKDIIKELIGNNEFLKSIVEGFKEQIDKDKELKQIVAGVFNSLTDVSNVLYETTKQHVIFNENNEMVDYKKGVIEENDLGYLDYKTAYNNYIEAGEQIIHIISMGYQEIVTRLNEQMKVLTPDEVNSITKVYTKEQIKLAKKTQTAVANVFKKLGGKPKSKPKQGERHANIRRETKPRSKNKYGSNRAKSTGTDNTGTTTSGTEAGTTQGETSRERETPAS